MTDPTIPILLERLLWPVPRVRWEAARALARLIRQNNVEATRVLLDWISSRELESEAVLGLDIIELSTLVHISNLPNFPKPFKRPLISQT